MEVGGKSQKAHRFMYERLVGPIPAGMQLDHLCRVRPCCNPAHLEPVTQRENIARGRGYAYTNRIKAECPSG
ncbi:HNH endonuclease signature motif containing protein, partial [Lacticaseibacillus paracasei]